MRKSVLLLTILTCLLQKKSDGQVTRQKLSLYAYNTIFGGVTTGLGSAINKNKEEKFLKVFWKGFTYGCIGSSISFTGKQLSYLINSDKNLYWAWPSKILHSYGVSVMENSASRNHPFTSVRFPVGFIMVGLDFKNKMKITPQLMPASLTNFIISAASKSKFNFSKTVQLGTPCFEYPDPQGRTFSGAYAQLNVITFINPGQINYYLAAHEHIHILQLREYYVLNTFFHNTHTVKKLRAAEKGFGKIVKQFVYPDINYVSIPYFPVRALSRNYFGNLFELEAEHFARNQFVNH
jgi:hypothetical protein